MDNQTTNRTVSTNSDQSSTDSDKPTLQDKLDIQFLRDADGQRAHRMNGFDPKFRDIVDYIIRITHEIWEEKAVGKLYDYYTNTIEVHTSSGTTYGREAIIASTLASLAAYPDRRLNGDDVIWGGDDIEGFYSSHRITHTGTNRGWSLYGPPTGKRISYRAIADCLCKANMIVEEWLVRDEMTLIAQLGLNPFKLARELSAKEVQAGLGLQVPGNVERGIGQYPPPLMPAQQTEGFDAEYFVRKAIHEVWNWRLVSKVREYFSETIALESASSRRLHGLDNYQAYVLSLLGAFPNLAITVEHTCHVGDQQRGYRVATRWRMRGTHTGYGVYGEPTGNEMQIMGISHHLIKDGKILNEWTFFDEFTLLRQIYRPPVVST